MDSQDYRPTCALDTPCLGAQHKLKKLATFGDPTSQVENSGSTFNSSTQEGELDPASISQVPAPQLCSTEPATLLTKLATQGEIGSTDGLAGFRLERKGSFLLKKRTAFLETGNRTADNELQLDIARPRTHSEHIVALQIAKQPSKSLKSIENGTYNLPSSGFCLSSPAEEDMLGAGTSSEVEKGIYKYLEANKICQIAVKEYLTDVYNFEIEVPQLDLQRYDRVDQIKDPLSRSAHSKIKTTNAPNLFADVNCQLSNICLVVQDEDHDTHTPLVACSSQVQHQHADVTPVFAKKSLGGRLRKNSSCQDLKSPEK